MRKNRKGILLVLIMFWLTVFLSGCASEDEPEKDPERDEATFQTETLSGEYLTNFPQVLNPVSFLGIPLEEITILKDTGESLLIAFKAEPDEEQERAYFLKIESLGFSSAIYDATISSTFAANDESCELSYTAVADLDVYREIHPELPELENVTDINYIFIVNQK